MSLKLKWEEITYGYWVRRAFCGCGEYLSCSPTACNDELAWTENKHFAKGGKHCGNPIVKIANLTSQVDVAYELLSCIASFANDQEASTEAKLAVSALEKINALRLQSNV